MIAQDCFFNLPMISLIIINHDITNDNNYYLLKKPLKFPVHCEKIITRRTKSIISSYDNINIITGAGLLISVHLNLINVRISSLHEF